MFLFRKNRELRGKIELYTRTGAETLDVFARGIQRYMETGLEGLETFVGEAHGREHACDVIRREIERELFEKSLLPELREDICRLIDHLDLLMNQAEDVLRQLVNQCIDLPAELKPGFHDLAGVSHDACRLVLEQALHAFEHDSHAKEYAQQVGELENRGDRIEQDLVRQVFRGPFELAEKLLYRDIITMTGCMADLAEEVADLVLVFRIKREI